ncbi:anaerobic ribonucleoside-triphosphate reductase activating protein [Nonomuraea fuscirosea]|uniref:Anaerobic ribonucleoside-triphosphate reductase activating protein n=1 Tax=Nonomuraea fuscirosea TaxID=1291556 RepID=A0A2T0N477_9ACTN|nr:4Fe-4S single cluster domain-containing protein [Nonomuraea fuscirosea]PRX66981.1 anaerobic ribonucleoside-triphosphate reductase activating protein [Nonomuraea fuscirosea]
MLNVAEICTATEALGSGIRAVVWVQGCPFHCRGCLAPDWIPDRPAQQMSPHELAAALLSDSRVTGLTFSGGEPMAQAAELAATARVVRAVKEVTLICFTGFRLEELTDRPAAAELLAEVDVLIDGRYVAARNDDRGLRGSANQRVHHLTDRLRGFDFTGAPRRAELHVNDRDVLLVGVPPSGLTAAWSTIGRGGM